MLGMLVASPEFVRAWADERMQEEQRLLQELPQLPPSCPRANHAIRTVPPNVVAPYAAAHDAAIRDAYFATCVLARRPAGCCGHGRGARGLASNFGRAGLATHNGQRLLHTGMG